MPVGAGSRSKRATHARVRLRWAQRNCNIVGEVRARTMKFAALDNFYRKSHRLVPINFDLLQPQFLDPKGTGEAWEPPKRAREFIGALAQVLLNWTILEKNHPHYGEPYSGFELSAEEIAHVFGKMSAKQWYRGAAYYDDGRLRNKPGTRAWLEHCGLLRVLSTTGGRAPWWRNRAGKPMPHGEDRCIYVAGPQLEKLMKLHRKRSRRSKRRAVNDHKRAVLAKRLRRLELRGGSEARRKTTRSPAILVPPGNSVQPKALVVSSSPEEELTNQPTPRRSAPNAPRISQLSHESPVGEGVGGQGRRRSRKASDAPPADRRHDRCSALSQNRNEPDPDGHEGPGCAVVGGELVMQRQAAPVAVGDAERSAALPPTSLSSDASAAIAAPGLLLPAPTNGDVLTEDEYVKLLIAGALRKTAPERMRREELYGPEQPKLPPSGVRLGRQGELPGGNPTEVLTSGDPADIVDFLEREAQKRWDGWKKAHGRQRDLPDGPTGPARAVGDALAGIFGGDRTPDERAENERRREAAKHRASASTNDCDDDDLHDVLDDVPDDGDVDGGDE